MEMKICGRCKEEYPKKSEYFFNKKYKQKLSNGGIREYTSLRSTCKNCHPKIQKEAARKRRCKIMGWKIENYEEEVSKHLSLLKLKHKELYGLSKGVINGLRKKIDEGYIYTNFEKHLKDCSLNKSLSKRKYNYYDKTKLVDPKTKNRSGIINLTDGYIAMTLGQKVKDVPKDILETKRLYLKLKREINETNYGKQKIRF